MRDTWAAVGIAAKFFKGLRRVQRLRMKRQQGLSIEDVIEPNDLS
jgi:hypothetical protein